MKYEGIIPPMVTPLRDRDALDVPGLERLVEHMLAGGIHGLFILGTTGEAPSLSYRLRRELVDRVCRQVLGRVPVLVGITDTALVESLALARHAAQAGAQAVVAAPPFYFPAGQPELLHYVEHLTAELPLPLFLYNMPMMTKVAFAPQTVRQLLGNARIVGVKDSSGDLGYFEQLLAVARERPDWSVLVGPEHLLADAVERGGQGGVNGGANLCPRLFVELYAAACRHDAPRRLSRASSARSRCGAFARTCWPNPSTASRAPSARRSGNCWNNWICRKCGVSRAQRTPPTLTPCRLQSALKAKTFPLRLSRHCWRSQQWHPPYALI
jgi:4-hydroxy-tetrahydrodipicolinate synthase